jgi:hypothetical protein
VGKPEGKRPLGRSKWDGWIILRWILEGFLCILFVNMFNSAGFIFQNFVKHEFF